MRGVMLSRVVLLLLLAATRLDAQSTLTIIAPAAPGGGWDQTARVMQRVLAQIEPNTNAQVDNIPGAAGTLGLARFVQSERGNPNALLVTGLVMVSGVITNSSPASSERQDLRRRGIQPLRIVDEAHERPFLGRLRQQTQHG